MTISYKIDGKLCDLNSYINAERANKFKAAKIKKDNTFRCMLACKNVPHVESYPLDIIIHWHTNGRKDPDNIAFAIKFILDGLHKGKVIDNDGHKQINRISHEFYIDKENDWCEVELIN